MIRSNPDYPDYTRSNPYPYGLMNGWSASHGLTNKNDCYDWMNDLQSAAIRIFFERIIRIIQKSGFWMDNPDVDQRIIPLCGTLCTNNWIWSVWSWPIIKNFFDYNYLFSNRTYRSFSQPQILITKTKDSCNAYITTMSNNQA